MASSDPGDLFMLRNVERHRHRDLRPFRLRRYGCDHERCAHARPCLDASLFPPTLGAGLSTQDELSQRNVVHQLRALETYPSVHAARETRELRLHGWWFDIRNARVSSAIGILFPIFIALLVPIRALLGRWISAEHLDALDAEESPDEVENEFAGP